MAAVTFFGYTLLKSNTEVAIRKSFEQYATALNAQKLKMCDEITEWGDALINSIAQHTIQQKHNLECEYSRRLNTLNKTCDRYVGEIRVREKINDTQEINQLLEQCKTLKFELDTLETSIQNIPFIHVPSKKKSAIKNQDRFDAAETGMIQLDNDSTDNNDNEVQNNVFTNPMLYRNPSFERTKQTETHSLPINLVYDGNRSINDNGNPEFSDAKENGYAKKCPVCFMIFPSTMTLPDRSQHVQEHYVNE